MAANEALLTADDAETFVCDFNWLRIWLKFSGCWYDPNDSPRKHALILTIFCTLMILMMLGDTGLIINRSTSYLHNIAIFNLISSRFTTDQFVSYLIENFLVQIIRACSLYYFYGTTHIYSTFNKLTFEYSKQTASIKNLHSNLHSNSMIPKLKMPKLSMLNISKYSIY